MQLVWIPILWLPYPALSPGAPVMSTCVIHFNIFVLTSKRRFENVYGEHELDLYEDQPLLPPFFLLIGLKFHPLFQFVVVVQSLSHVWLFANPRTAARQASLFFTISRSLLKFMFTVSVMPSNHLILCRPLLLPSIVPSIRVFSNESILPIRWPKYWSFSFSITPFNEYSGLISFSMDWLDLLAVQWTLKSLLQHHSSKASILWHSAFFMVQLSHPYMTTEKTIALTIGTFVVKMSLLFNLLCSFVIPLLWRNKLLLISWLQSPSAMILEPPQNKICHRFHLLPFYLPWSDGTGSYDLSFLNVKF